MRRRGDGTGSLALRSEPSGQARSRIVASPGWLAAAVGLAFACGGGSTDPEPVTTHYSLTVTLSGNGAGSVSSTPTGISCSRANGANSGNCSASFAEGTSVTLAATQAGGATFGGWSGSCSGASACAVAMSGARSVGASFTAAAPQVASVVVQAPSPSLVVGTTMQLTATARDASNAPVQGTTFTWRSGNESIATVAGGVVTAHAAGNVTIYAAAGSIEGSVALAVIAPTAARVVVSPSFRTIVVGQTATYTAEAFQTSGAPISGPAITWSSSSHEVAQPAAGGSFTGVAAGSARVAARVDQASDTALLAVVQAQGLVATAFVGGNASASAIPGQSITVQVALDMSRASATGDLGSVEFELLYDAAVLEYQSATSALAGSAEFNVSTPGRFRFAFASTSAQGSAQLALATVTFRVLPAAVAGSWHALTLRFDRAPTSTNFTTYLMPIAVGGRLRIGTP